jgi:hypothetical protein
MNNPKLFMLLVGCTPPGRHTEQHDVFFGIARKLSDLKPQLLAFWPEAQGKIHIDAWREVNFVNNFCIKPEPRTTSNESTHKLFFLNLGGYKFNEFEEYHYKLLTVAKTQAAAIKEAKQTAFYKHFDAPGANSHIDDKYGIDVDDLYDVEDILPASAKENYRLEISPSGKSKEDEINIGYLKLSKL